MSKSWHRERTAEGQNASLSPLQTGPHTHTAVGTKGLFPETCREIRPLLRQ